jgi:hypothetical protein
LCLCQRREYLSVQQFIPHLPVKGFDITVLPGTALLNTIFTPFASLYVTSLHVVTRKRKLLRS